MGYKDKHTSIICNSIFKSILKFLFDHDICKNVLLLVNLSHLLLHV